MADELTALAAAGGTAVAQAAGTDAWTSVRALVAGLFRRTQPTRERVMLQRLDETAGALSRSGDGQQERVHDHARSWRDRFEDLLAELGDAEREEAARQLRELAGLVRQEPAQSVSAGDSGVAVRGDVTIRAEGGSVAGGVIQGGVSLGNPPVPGAPHRG